MSQINYTGLRSIGESTACLNSWKFVSSSHALSSHAHRKLSSAYAGTLGARINASMVEYLNSRLLEKLPHSSSSVLNAFCRFPSSRFDQWGFGFDWTCYGFEYLQWLPSARWLQPVVCPSGRHLPRPSHHWQHCRFQFFFTCGMYTDNVR